MRPAPPAPASAAGAASASARERYRLGERHGALTVATNLPHKNLAALLDAIALIAPAQRPLLVIAGHGTEDGALAAHARALGGSREDVRLLGGAHDRGARLAVRARRCLVLPTLHEGFGLPVLEAMARSLPVACSDIAALREVAGEAALYFDPRTPAQIAARLTEILDPAVATRLRALGLAQAARFSWAAAAEGTLRSYRRALGL